MEIFELHHCRCLEQVDEVRGHRRFASVAMPILTYKTVCALFIHLQDGGRMEAPMGSKFGALVLNTAVFCVFFPPHIIKTFKFRSIFHFHLFIW